MYSYNGNRVVLLLIPAKPYHHHHFELFSQAVVARAMTPQHNDAKSTKKIQRRQDCIKIAEISEQIMQRK